MSDHSNSASAFEVQRVFDEAHQLFRTKNADYGDAWRQRGWMGNLSRVGEKVQRLETALWHEGPVGFSVSEETARETALDIINTMAFFIINWDQHRRWGTEAVTVMPPAPEPASVPRVSGGDAPNQIELLGGGGDGMASGAFVAVTGTAVAQALEQRPTPRRRVRTEENDDDFEE